MRRNSAETLRKTSDLGVHYTHDMLASALLMRTAACLNPRGMTVYRPRQLAFAAASLAALTIGWAARSEAQVIYPYPYPPPYAYGYGEPLASVRIEVEPKEAEVYV